MRPRPRTHTFPRGRPGTALRPGLGRAGKQPLCRGCPGPRVQPPSSDGAAGHSRPRGLSSPTRASGFDPARGSWVSVSGAPPSCCSPPGVPTGESL